MSMLEHTVTKIRQLLEADDRLRKLERGAKASPLALKRYITELLRTEEPKDIVFKLIDTYDILPGISVFIEITPEPAIEVIGNAGDDSQEQWVLDELEAGNMYAWCMARVAVRWAGHLGDDFMGAISVNNKKEAEELAVAHGMVGVAAGEIVNNLGGPTGLPTGRRLQREVGLLSNGRARKYVDAFLHGKENEDWAHV